MSYLVRISARSGSVRRDVALVRPKGIADGHTATIARAEEAPDEKETLSPMRPYAVRRAERQEDSQDEEVSRREANEESETELAAARNGIGGRLAQRRTEEKEEKEEIATLRRQDDTEEEVVSPLRRQEMEEEEKATRLMRQEEEEEEEVAPLRRQETEQEVEEGPEARSMRTIARQEEIPLEDTGQTAPPPTQAELEPGAEQPDQELAGESEPSELQALHRDIATDPGGPAPTPATQTEPSEKRSATVPPAETSPYFRPHVPLFDDETVIPSGVAQGSRADESRPTVVIDQLDVLIHEPADSANRNLPDRSRERTFRARYLRRL